MYTILSGARTSDIIPYIITDQRLVSPTPALRYLVPSTIMFFSTQEVEPEPPKKRARTKASALDEHTMDAPEAPKKSRRPRVGAELEGTTMTPLKARKRSSAPTPVRNEETISAAFDSRLILRSVNGLLSFYFGNLF